MKSTDKDIDYKEILKNDYKSLLHVDTNIFIKVHDFILSSLRINLLDCSVKEINNICEIVRKNWENPGYISTSNIERRIYIDILNSFGEERIDELKFYYKIRIINEME